VGPDGRGDRQARCPRFVGADAVVVRKQRNNERNEIDRARKAAEDCAKRNP
jgi:hypothetical protein